ncbi:MAG TPA: serine hydrolase domain-containing protein, partial [Thermoanaerobaculia bacterium]|nr:serine hydrolase domain-containing protein [Thermoanaerobaculia bacterium]
EEAAPRLFTLSDFAKLFVNKPTLFPPGKGRQYSNAGYIVLGLIVEKVSGQSYHDYVRDHVFAPAGMISSGPSARGVSAGDLAVGYTRGAEGAASGGGAGALHPNTQTLPARSSSAGGGLSTVEDLLAFEEALRTGKLLPPAWTAWAYSDKTSPPSDGDRIPKDANLGIAGGSPGVNAVLEADAGRDFTIVVLANLDPPIAERTATKIRKWIERIAGSSTQ